MKAKITTTITTWIDMDSFVPSHDVDINTEDELPKELVVAAVYGGIKAAKRTLENQHPGACRVDELYRYTIADAETLLGRELSRSELSGLRQTLEHGLADEASDLTFQHFGDQGEEED